MAKAEDDARILDGEAGFGRGRADAEVTEDGALVDRRRVIAASRADVERLGTRLDKSGLVIEDVAPIDGIDAVVVTLVAQGDDLADVVERAETLARRADDDGRVARVARRHLLVSAPFGRGHPGGIPTPAALPPLPPPSKAQRRPRVAVVDSGYARGVSPALDARVSGAGSEPGPLDADGWRLTAAGHGTFIAGLIARLAPAARIEMHVAMEPDGAVYEDDAARALVQIAKDPPDVVSLSFGGWTVGDRMPAPLAQALALLPETTVVVAAAGNERSTRPRFPAASPRVVGVAAMAARGRVADFSNVGPWVDCAAPGVGLASTFVQCVETAAPVWAVQKGFRPHLRRPETFAGGATWSGTSFAAPWVAGKVLAAMSTGRPPAPDARRALLRLLARGALSSRYDVGVLLPYETI